MSELPLPARSAYAMARVPKRGDWLDRAADAAFVRPWLRFRVAPEAGFAHHVTQARRALAGASDAALRNGLAVSGAGLRRGVPRALEMALAHAAEAAARALSLEPYPCQILAARALHLGAIAEMDTGEGKTLAAGLAATVRAASGARVHVITANDYLAERDAINLAPLFGMLGLSAGHIIHGMEPGARRAMWRKRIVHCSNKEVAFDHLRDRLAMAGRRGELELKLMARTGPREGFLLPGLSAAIVDEADSVLIDEARTPLILSATPPDAEAEIAAIRVALGMAQGLREQADFTIDRQRRAIRLEAGGVATLDRHTETFPARWRPRPMREELLRMALSALHLHRQGDHYLLRDGKVVIIDEYTGRAAPDRSWSAGLHQAVEIKEGCDPTPRRDTLAQITYQRFFRRYPLLCGMTGTAREAASEFWSVYRLPVARIAPHRPNRRRHCGCRVFPDEATKWTRVAARAAALAADGRPVLIGTRSVAASDCASAALSAIGVPHRVLSATQDADEAGVISRAGQPGSITVATNMAGRGADIPLGAGVADAGGLHVILTERHTARRIDRQLAGRCARQGDPGSVEVMLSCEDDILVAFGRGPRGAFSRALARLAGQRAHDRAQRRAERLHSRARARLLELDEQMAESLAFAGMPE